MKKHSIIYILLIIICILGIYYFNNKEEIQYKDKTVLNNSGVPLIENTENNTIEILAALNKKGVEPEPGCNLYDSGTIGCYEYYLESGKEKNYWNNPQKLKSVVTYKKPYNKTKFMTFTEFLNDNSPTKFDRLKFNKKGELLYKNKIVLNDRGQAVNNKYEYSTPEFNVIIALGNVYPEPQCFNSMQKDKEIGCFQYYIKNEMPKNYWL